VKHSLIQVGKTYRNRGKGRTTRTVLAIVTDGSIRPHWFSSSPAPNEPVVVYRQGGPDTDSSRESSIYLKSFATWCGEEVAESEQATRPKTS
jgi:hypothetical protein